MKRLIALTILSLVASTAAFADIARPTNTPKPKPEKTWNGQMRIDTRSTNVGIATLTISKDKLKQLRAALDEADTDDSNAAVASTDLGRTQTIVAGLLLSLGLGTFLLLTLFLVRTTLLKEVEFSGSGGRPNLLLFDIQDDQIEDLRKTAAAAGAPVLVQAPIVTMKIAGVKGRKVEEWLRESAPRERREAEGGRRGDRETEKVGEKGGRDPRRPARPHAPRRRRVLRRQAGRLHAPESRGPVRHDLRTPPRPRPPRLQARGPHRHRRGQRLRAPARHAGRAFAMIPTRTLNLTRIKTS